MLSNSILFSGYVRGKLVELVRDDQFTLLRKKVDERRTGKHNGVKLITSIDNSIASVIEELLNIGVEVKHNSISYISEFLVLDKALRNYT